MVVTIPIFVAFRHDDDSPLHHGRRSFHDGRPFPDDDPVRSRHVSAVIQGYVASQVRIVVRVIMP